MPFIQTVLLTAVYHHSYPEPLESTPNHSCSKIILLPFPFSARCPTRSTNHTCCNNKLVLTIFSNFTQCATCTAHVTFLPPLPLISSSTISKTPNCCSHLQEANSSTYEQNLIPGPYFEPAESDQDPHAQFPLTQCNSSTYTFS